MSDPNNSGDVDERHKLLNLLDRLDAVHPKCMPDVIVGQWAVGDPAARRTIEGSIDRLPRRKKAN